MADSSASIIFSVDLPIPIDLFVSKKHPDCFVNSFSDIIYRVLRQPLESPFLDKRILLDPSGNPLISMFRNDKGSWQGFKGDNGVEDNLLFRAQRTIKKLAKTEFKVSLVSENSDDSTPSLKMKGLPFQRSCTVYKDDAIVAQTSLMYKLHQVFARRGRFRVTIFPGSIDPALVVALVVIFFDGRR